MMKYFYIVLVFSLLSACEHDGDFQMPPEVIDEQPIFYEDGFIYYTEMGKSKSFEAEIEKHVDDVYVIGKAHDISINVHHLQVGTYRFSAGTLDEATSVRYNADSTLLDHFSSAYLNTIQGELIIETYDQVNQVVNGKFSFELIQFSGTEEKPLKLTEGVIRNVPVVDRNQLNSDGTFRGKIHPTEFDSLAYYFLSVLSFNDRLEISMAHSCGHRFTMILPKQISLGLHHIPQTDLGETEDTQLVYRTSRTGTPYYIPSNVNKPMIHIVYFDKVNKELQLDITGNYEDDDGNTITFEAFNIELHNW